MLNPISEIAQDNRGIMIIDFSNLKENQMMQLISEARALLLREQRSQKVMAVFNEKNFITPKFMRHFETDQIEAIVFIAKQAVVGLTSPQKMILKGYNIFQNRNIRAFDAPEEAIKYLLDDSKDN